MNRAERRKQEQMGMSKAHVMQEYRREAYDEGYKRGMQDVVDITFYLTAYTLSYAIDGMTNEKLQEVCRRIYNNIDSFRSGHLTPQDYDAIVEQVRNEFGIKLN